MKVNDCDFCGASKIPRPGSPGVDALHDIFHLTGWPAIICTNCMDKHFGTTEEEAILKLAHDRLIEKLGVEEE